MAAPIPLLVPQVPPYRHLQYPLRRLLGAQVCQALLAAGWVVFDAAGTLFLGGVGSAWKPPSPILADYAIRHLPCLLRRQASVSMTACTSAANIMSTTIIVFSHNS